MELKQFLAVSERYLSHDPIAVISKSPNFFWYIQDRLVADRKGVNIKKAVKQNRSIAYSLAERKDFRSKIAGMVATFRK